jgi:glycosyltransferase involved in cell wall biosynthesis
MSALNLSEQKSSFPCRGLPLASIIIISYNYEKFLPRAIDSALQQTYPLKEIIVVDDGSTDNSRHIINQYGNRITSIFQENRGAASATNTGFFASRGEIIFFLDSDDVFFPHKLEEMVKYYLQVIPQKTDVLILHRLELTTDEGIILRLLPEKGLCTLDGQRKNGPFEKLSDPEAAYRHIQKWGFLPFMVYSISGLSMTRTLARRIFPLPEERVLFRDCLLICGAMLIGTVYGISQVLGSFVIHGDNFSLKAGGFGSQNDRSQITINFVNDILQKINKDRIASFDDSRYAKSYYKNSGSTKGLLKLAYTVPARYFCWETMWFSIKTLWLCLRMVLGIKKGSQLTKKTKQFQKAKKM